MPTPIRRTTLVLLLTATLGAGGCAQLGIADPEAERRARDDARLAAELERNRMAVEERRQQLLAQMQADQLRALAQQGAARTAPGPAFSPAISDRGGGGDGGGGGGGH